jgi:hypothetical protein
MIEIKAGFLKCEEYTFYSRGEVNFHDTECWININSIQHLSYEKNSNDFEYISLGVDFDDSIESHLGLTYTKIPELLKALEEARK